MTKSREQQLYEELLNYNAALLELEKMSEEDLKYYYSTYSLKEEIEYLKQLIEEQYEMSKNDNTEEENSYEDRIDEQAEVISKELIEIAKTDSEEIRKELISKLNKKYNMFNNIMVGLNVKDALDEVLSIDDEIKSLDDEINLLEESLNLFDDTEKSYNKFVDYSDNLELFRGTETWKNVNECIDTVQFYRELLKRYNNKYMEFDYKYNNALECNKEYNNLKFYKKLSKKAIKLRKEIKKVNYYNNVKEKYKNCSDYCLTKYNKACDNVKIHIKDFNYYSEKLFNKTVTKEVNYNEILSSYINNKNLLANEYFTKKKELVKNLKIIFKDEKEIDRNKIVNKLNNIKEIRNILKTVSYSDRFFKNNPDINKDKIRNILPDSEKVKMSEKDIKKMVLKLNINKK